MGTLGYNILMAIKYLAGNRIQGTAAERTGMTTFSDGMGSAVNGYSTGVALETSVRSDSGFSTSALRWDGSDSEMILEPSGDEDTNVFSSFTGVGAPNTKPMTIAFWVNFDTAPSEFRIISKENTSHGGFYYDLVIRGFDTGNFEEHLLQEIADLKDVIADQEERIRSFDQRLGIHWKIIEKQVDWVI